MELLRSYDSDETSSEDCGSFQEALGEKEVRSVYLITYSQANLIIIIIIIIIII